MGYPVMGESGRIRIDGEDIRISRDGVIEADGVDVATLKVVLFEDPNQLKRAADGLFVDSGRAGLKKADEKNVQPGYLEMSNASVMKEMVQMIDIQRSFELYQKAIQTVSEQDRLAVSRVGRLA
jgi:flagellar basal-body rod protein FlgG